MKTFERINSLITEHSFYLQSWNDNFGIGVWTCLATNSLDLDEFRGLSENSRTSIDANHYIADNNWFPVATGTNFIDSMNILEQLLSTIPSDMLKRDSIWTSSIHKALENLREWHRSNFQEYQPLPTTFEELLTTPIIEF